LLFVFNFYYFILGVVVSAVVNEIDEKTGFLIILDGRNFEELARAAFSTQSAIPTDFHGMFLHRD